MHGNTNSIEWSLFSNTKPITEIWSRQSLSLHWKQLHNTKHFLNEKQLYLLSEIWYYLINSLRPSDAYICISKFTIIGSDNGLSPDRRQAIIWTNAGILLIRPSGTNFSEISIEIDTFSFKKMQMKMSSGKWRPFCLGFNELNASSWAIY